MKRRTLTFFLTVIDEAALSVALKKKFPEIKFIDGATWDSKEPPTKAAISDCKSCLVYLWDAELFPELEVRALKNGLFRGPQTYSVIQFNRCRKDGDRLYHGQASMTIDPDDADQKQFCEAVARIIRKRGAGRLMATNLEDSSVVGTGITGFITGSDAYERAGGDLVLTYAHCRYLPDR